MKDDLPDRELSRIAGDLAEVASYLWERGWAERNAGNISADVTEIVDAGKLSGGEAHKIAQEIPHAVLRGRLFLITATGSRLRELVKNMQRNLLLVRISEKLDGYYVLWGGEGGGTRATSECPAHFTIHGFLRENDFEQNVVLHTHPNHVVALTHIEPYTRENSLNRLLWSMHPEVRAVLPEGVGLAPYRCPGTDELAEVSIASLAKHRVCVWEKHGCVAIGRDVFEAFDLIDTVNKAAVIYFLCRSAGYEPQGLCAADLEEVDRNFKSPDAQA